MQKEIIAAIAAYLEENLSTYHDGYADVLGWKRFAPGMQDVIATEIASAIAPIVAEKDLPLSELFTHMSEQYDLTLTDTELADIIQVARKGAPLLEPNANWKDAPEWAQWVLIHNDGETSYSKGYPMHLTTDVVKIERRPQ